MFFLRTAVLAACVVVYSAACSAQNVTALDFAAIVAKFRANNPDIAAASLLTDEARANEITANLRPNPVFTLNSVQNSITTAESPVGGNGQAELIPDISYLYERQKKRQLRTESARLATSVQSNNNQDLERNLLFSLRDAYNRALQAKSILQLAQENLDYYDKVIDANRARYQAGDISVLDLERVELQRVQFQTDVVTATQNLRTAKIQLLSLMNEHSLPVDRFEVAGDFDYHETPLLLPEVHEAALESRPDLQAAEVSIRKAEADRKLAIANGTSDPTFGLMYQRDPQLGSTIGLSVSMPVRVFDKNQGEKARTAIEVRRTERQLESVRSAVLRDVDSAYEQVLAARNLILPYREKYLKQAEEVRERVSFAYSKGGASLLEFLDAQKTYRDTELAYRNLIGSYLSAAAQLNLAAGKEIVK